MTKRFKVGDHVTWNSEAGHVSGKIIEVHTANADYKGDYVGLDYNRHSSSHWARYTIILLLLIGIFGFGVLKPTKAFGLEVVIPMERGVAPSFHCVSVANNSSKFVTAQVISLEGALTGHG